MQLTAKTNLKTNWLWLIYFNYFAFNNTSAKVLLASKSSQQFFLWLTNQYLNFAGKILIIL